MPKMLKIGEFAHACHAKSRTLRYYDSEGILQADYVDVQTGYRYYHPDKLETYRLIRRYQDVGFSLEEIKILLSDGPDAALRRVNLMSDRRLSLNRDLQAVQGKLSILEEISRERMRNREVDIFTAVSAAHVDDPALPGRWELAASLPDGRLSSNGVPTPEVFETQGRAGTENVRALFHRLVFLPEGKPWWAFLWTRGTVYVLCPAYHTVAPCPYTLFERADGMYMALRLCLPDMIKEDMILWLLYRRVEHRPLGELESHTRRDETDLPLCPDPTVAGEWQAVDFVSDPADFVPDSPAVARAHLWPVGLTLSPQGVCTRRLASPTGMREESRTYTRTGGEGEGAVLYPERAVAEGYRMVRIGEDDYLFVEHKSGDYMYGGLNPPWYVYRRNHEAEEREPT